ncbi:MAG TPA: hypothetical protein VE860_16165 [Chthoniobacterales bacterium]|nr:hypothetical protein [Chthoniobacterales bacterium]
MLQSQTNQASRIDLTNTILEAKAQKGISFEELANGTGLNVAFVTAALLGQHPLPTEAAKVVGKKLQLHENAVALLQTVPWRGNAGGTNPGINAALDRRTGGRRPWRYRKLCQARLDPARAFSRIAAGVQLAELRFA